MANTIPPTPPAGEPSKADAFEAIHNVVKTLRAAGHVVDDAVVATFFDALHNEAADPEEVIAVLRALLTAPE